MTAAPELTWAASLDELTIMARQWAGQVEAALIGGQDGSALRAVQRVHAADRSIAVLLVGDDASRDALMRQLMFTPQIGSDVQWVALSPDADLSQAAQQAAQRTRTRRQLGRLVARTNAQLAPPALPAPAPFLEHLLDQAPLGVVTLNGSGQVESWNPAASRLLPGLHPGLALRELLPGLPSSGGQAVRLEHGLGSGARRVLRAHVSAMSRPGQTVGQLVLLEDITPYVHAEEAREAAQEELRALNATLEARVAQRTLALEQQALALQRSNAELERFAYIASHDLQEPLRTITSFTELFMARSGDQLDARARHYLHFVQDGSARMKALIDDLLAFSRLNAERPPPRLVDTGEPVQEALARLADRIAVSGARVEVGPLPAITGDAPQLAQLFQNLISNALKFQRPGVPPEVRVTAISEGEWWRFRIHDNGIGIEPQYSDRIFVMFQRLHGREVYEGTGLGLAICRKIVEAHGGSIGVESIPGKGSTFWFTLPAVGSAEAVAVSG
ncbi:sensor histidine kinase [Deinococcus malanensis]|nr:ATP-binding protein [Deinococcus malanensis]